MPRRTDSAARPVHRRIGLAFDFDDTLAPDSYAGLLAHCGCDPEEFVRARVQPLLDDGWEEQNAKIYALVQESRQRRGPDKITRGWIREFAAQLDVYPGVPALLDRLRDRVRHHDPDGEIDVEYYVISSGLVDIPLGMDLAAQFSAMWGCELGYTDGGEIDFARRIVTHFGKVRYLRLITRVGPDGDASAGPRTLYGRVPSDRLHVPFGQLVYTASDLPAFTVVRQEGGIAIGVRKPGSGLDWEAGRDLDDATVDAVVDLDYAPGSALDRALVHAVDKACAQIALRGLGPATSGGP